MKKMVLASLVPLISIQATTLELKEGWNLVGSSVDNVTVSTTFADANSVWKFSNADNDWQIISPNETLSDAISNANATTFTTVNAGDGFWVNMTKDKTITLTGDTPSTTDLILADGWNLVSLKADDANVTANEVFGTNNQILWKYTNKEWKAYSSSATINNALDTKNIATFDTISSGEGFWVKNVDDQNITFENLANHKAGNMGEDFDEYDEPYNPPIGWGERAVAYNGVTDSTVNITVPPGSYNIYAEIVNADTEINAVMGTLQDVNGNSLESDINGTNNKIATPYSPSMIQLTNSSDGNKTYVLPVSAQSKYVNGSIYPKVATNISVITVTQNNDDGDGGNLYEVSATLDLNEDIASNMGFILNPQEPHTWNFTTGGDAAGLYDLSVLSDADVNILSQFNVTLSESYNGKTVLTDDTDTGNFTQSNVELKANTVYQLKIFSNADYPRDALGQYGVKLIKQ
jgi:hypothetical protein